MNTVHEETLSIKIHSRAWGPSINYRLGLPGDCEDFGLKFDAKSRLEMPQLAELYDQPVVIERHSARELKFRLLREADYTPLIQELGNHLRETLGKPGLTLDVTHICPHCGNNQSSII
jgi:hypothetical protein